MIGMNMKMGDTGNCPYGNLELSPADNGHKVTYYEKMKRPGASMYDQMESSRREFVFGTKELDKAVAKYKEIAMCIMEYKGGDGESSHESKEGESEEGKEY